MTLLRRSRVVLVPALAACLALSLACGSEAPADDGSGGNSSSGGSDTAAGGDTADSGGSSSGGSASGGQPGGSGGQPSSGGTVAETGGNAGTDDDSIGRVQVYRTLAVGPSGGQVTATFDFVEQAAWDALDTEPSPCTRTTYGSCKLTSCPLVADPDPDPDPDLPSSARLDAGAMTVRPDSGDFLADGLPSGENGAYAFTGSGSIGGEEIITVSAAGGTIDAFVGTVQVPLAPLLTVPAVTGESGMTFSVPVSRQADFALSWDARGTGQTMETVVIPPSGAPAETPLLSCTFEAAAGSGILSGEALAQLPAGTTIHFFSLTKAEVTTAQGIVELWGFFEMLSEDKTVYPQFVLE